MSRFDKTLFEGNPVVAGVLIPILLVSAAVWPFLVDRWTTTKYIAVTMVSSAEVLLALGLFNPRRCWWALRGVTAIVVAAYAWYFATQLKSGEPLFVDGQRSSPSILNVLMGFMVIGLPSLWYTLFGRFFLTKENQPPLRTRIKPMDKEGSHENRIF